MSQPHTRSLSAIVEKPRHEEITVGGAGGAQILQNVQAMAPISDVHRVEEGRLRRGEP